MARKRVDKLTKEWIRNAADEEAVRAGCWFNQDRGLHVVNFFRSHLRHYVGRYAGMPFELLEWQEYDLVMPLYSWQRPDGTRRFREADVWIPKKNGKTTIASGLSLVGLVADGEKNATIYSTANSRDQAGMVYANMEAMVQASPHLNRELELIRSKKRIVYERTRSFYQALSADASSVEGIDAHQVIKDELHAWTGAPGRRFYNAIQYAGASRSQPLSMVISTSGDDTTSVGFERYEYCKKLIDGVLVNWEVLALIYECANHEDPDDEEVWHRANPSLGHTITLDSFRAAARDSKSDPAKRQSFLRYRLNRWVTAKPRWLNMQRWDECKPFEVEDLDQYRGSGGLDLGLVADSTAWVICFDMEDGSYVFLAHYFLPEERIFEKEKEDGVPYTEWADQGIVTITPGRTTDFNMVEERIRHDWERYGLDDVGYDPWKAQMLATRLSENHNIDMVEFRQGYATMAEPCERFERLVANGQVRHNGNPFLRWNAENAVVRLDPAGNKKPDKANSKKRIDGLIGCIISFGLCSQGDDSVYEDRGIRML